MSLWQERYDLNIDSVEESVLRILEYFKIQSHCFALNHGEKNLCIGHNGISYMTDIDFYDNQLNLLEANRASNPKKKCSYRHIITKKEDVWFEVVKYISNR